MPACLFCKIIQGDVPAQKVYEDAHVMAFHDIHPQAPVHLLLVPKRHIDSLLTTTTEDEIILGKLLGLTAKLAQAHGLQQGFKTAINSGVAGGQEVLHLHLHVYGTPQ